MAEQSINIPQLIAVALVGFLVIRWFVKPTTSAGSSSPPPSRGRAVDATKVEQVASMFPQLDRRTIAWDLQRNGGSVSATTERVLSGRTLDTPPPTFQPQLPAPAPAQNSSITPKPAPGLHPDLITKYNLQSRVSGKGKEPEVSEEQKRQAWSSDKAARAEGLKRRRDEMILAARRKMEAKAAEGS